MTTVKIDMNGAEFQRDLFNLEKNEQIALMKTLRKISQLTWAELYSDPGLKWEAITSKKTKSNERIYSFRFSQKYRGTALRRAEFLVLLALYVNHDGAYK